MKNFLFTISIFVFFLVQTGFSCTLGITGLSEFDTKEYIFIGEVVGYTQPIEAKIIRGKAVGLVVKLKESVYLPKTPSNNFEVFPFLLMADCSLTGESKDFLEKHFTIGTEIRVIAKDSQLLPESTSIGNIRLEDAPGELTSIALNVDEKGKRLTNADSIFDYQNYVKPNYDDYGETNVSAFSALNLLPEFELRKDLLRLKNSQTQQIRNQILDRLLFSFKIREVNLNASELFETYTSNEAEYERYLETHLKMVLSKDAFQELMTFRNYQKELVKLGYKKDSAELAVGRTIYVEQIKFPKKKVIQRSLEIVKVYDEAFSKLLDSGFNEEEIRKTLNNDLENAKKLTVQNLFEESRNKLEQKKTKAKLAVEVQTEIRKLGYDEKTSYAVFNRAYREAKEFTKPNILIKSLEILKAYEYALAELTKQKTKEEDAKMRLFFAFDVISDEQNITGEKLIKTVLEILPKNK